MDQRKRLNFTLVSLLCISGSLASEHVSIFSTSKNSFFYAKFYPDYKAINLNSICINWETVYTVGQYDNNNNNDSLSIIIIIFTIYINDFTTVDDSTTKYHHITRHNIRFNTDKSLPIRTVDGVNFSYIRYRRSTTRIKFERTRNYWIRRSRQKGKRRYTESIRLVERETFAWFLLGKWYSHGNIGQRGNDRKIGV